MTNPIGKIRSICQHPIKSMAGRFLDRTELDWHGLAGDRRFAFRRLDLSGGFPWLSASRLPRLLLYQPVGPAAPEPPTHVRTPEGRILELWSDDLRTELSKQLGSQVELMNLRNGIFDEASISIITSGTLKALEQATSRVLDVRRFRPNIVVDTIGGQALEEDAWVGKTLRFGNADPWPKVSVTMLDQRCSMISLDPDSAESDPAILRAAVRLNENNAGVYGTVTGIGCLAIGDPAYLCES